MTALKWITNEAKKLKKAYPKRFAKWTDYVAQASAIYAAKHKGKSPVGKKKKIGDYHINKADFAETHLITSPRKKTEKKKKSYAVYRNVDGTFKQIKRISGMKKKAQSKVRSLHKDTHSHNVNIEVVSGMMSASKQRHLNMLVDHYAKVSGKYLIATGKEKTQLKKLMTLIKREISKNK